MPGLMDARAVRFAGAMTLVLAALMAAAAVVYFILPADQRLGVPGRQLLPSFNANPLPVQLETLTLAAIGVIGLAVVGPLRDLIGGGQAWLRWLSNLALVGYGVGAIGNMLVFGKLPGIAAAYVAADAAAQPTIAVFWRTTLDPHGLWQFGAVGVWLIALGLVAWRSTSLPRLGAYLAVVAGVAQLLIPVLLLASAQSALGIVALVAGLVVAAWFAWVGLYLWRGDAATTAPA